MLAPNTVRSRTMPTVYSSGGNRALDETSLTDVQTPPCRFRPATYYCFHLLLI